MTMNMELDYELISGMEEWAEGEYRITDDFYRLIIRTEKAQKAFWRIFGKMVPLDSVIKLEMNEMAQIKGALWSSNGHKLCGTYGSYRVKSFGLDTFYGTEDATASEDEKKYDFEWSDLWGLA